MIYLGSDGMKKTSNKTKSRIVTAAWNLFYEQGFDDTTIDEIVALSKTSKGSFYHYFDSKESLLGSLAYLFDEKYVQLQDTLDDSWDCIDTLLYLNKEMFFMIENSIDMELLTRLYAQQLVAKGEKELTDQSREYYKLLKRIVAKGQDRQEITKEKSTSEIVRLYAMCERALIYDWCLHKGNYSLKEYSQSFLPMFLSSLRIK